MIENQKHDLAFKICLIVYVILILTVQTECNGKGKGKIMDGQDVATPGSVFTTPAEEEDPTPLPQKDIDDALNLDYGKYSTVSFHYEREQWMHSTWVDRCYDDYTKCITSQIAPTPVCMFYTQWFNSGYKYALSYCDAYLENCRVGYRYWRLIGNGKCDLGTIFTWDNIEEV